MPQVNEPSLEKKQTWTEIHLNALRGLAALVVALGHVRGLFFGSLTGTSSSSAVIQAAPQLTIGHEAVIVFFVLSGFLVGGSVLKSMRSGSWAWQNYLIKRLTRLWIVLIPAIFIGIAIDTFGFHFVADTGSLFQAPTGQDYVKAEFLAQDHNILIVLGNIFFLQTVFVPTLGTNIALWSLSNEFWYYLMFPMLLMAIWPRTGLVHRLGNGAGALCIAFMIGPEADYLFLTWLLGALVSILPRCLSPVAARWAVALLMAAFALVFLTIKKYGLPLYASEIILAALAAVLIYFIKCQANHARNTIYSRVSRFFSNISYTLYLTHLPFAIMACALINSPWKLSAFSFEAGMSFSIVATAVILWSSLIYYLFESRTDQVRPRIEAFFKKLSQTSRTERNLLAK